MDITKDDCQKKKTTIIFMISLKEVVISLIREYISRKKYKIKKMGSQCIFIHFAYNQS